MHEQVILEVDSAARAFPVPSLQPLNSLFVWPKMLWSREMPFSRQSFQIPDPQNVGHKKAIVSC